MAKLACVARCNNAGVELHFGVDVTVEKFRQDVMSACSKRRVYKFDSSSSSISSSTESGDISPIPTGDASIMAPSSPDGFEPSISCCQVLLQALNKVLVVNM